MRHRTLSAALAGVTLAASLAACGSEEPVAAGSPTSGEVTVMGYTAIFQDNYTEAVIELCEDKYPDIEVNYEPAQSSAQMLATLRSQQGDPNVDVAIMDVSVAAAGNEEGIFTPLDPELVPNLADIAERGVVEGNYGPAVTFDNLVLLHNTEAVTTEPTSWEELWDPAHAGKVAIPAAPDIQGFALTMIVNQMEGADYTETIDPAVARLSELAPAVQTWEPNPDTYTLVTNGTSEVAIGWNARAQTYADQSEGRLGVTLPEEGSVFQINTINLVADSPTSEAAQTFINCALSPDAQTAFTEAMYYAPTNTKAEVSDEALARTAVSEAREGKMIDVDWDFVSEKRDAWTELWRRQIIGA